MRRFLLAAATAAAASAAAAQGEPVTRIVSDGPAPANAYLVDAGSGIAVVDAHPTLSGGRTIAARIGDSGKAPAGILLTHPQPDAVGGLPAIVEATEAPVFGASDTAVELGADTRKLLALAHAMAPADTAPVPPAPDTIVRDGETVRVGDLDVEVVEFGASEATNTTVYIVPALNAAFVGDLVTPGATPFLLEKRTEAWLEQLDALAARLPAEIIAYPTHGEPAPIGDAVAAQKAWLTGIRDAVKAAQADGVVSEAEAAKIVAAAPPLPPTSAIPDLAKRNVIAVAAELAGDPGAPPLATMD